MFMQMKQAQLKKTEEENFQVGNLTEKKFTTDQIQNISLEKFFRLNNIFLFQKKV